LSLLKPPGKLFDCAEIWNRHNLSGGQEVLLIKRDIQFVSELMNKLALPVIDSPQADLDSGLRNDVAR
jgi:hypothetical protein